jgi:Flp pilus assembly pilin Flp
VPVIELDKSMTKTTSAINRPQGGVVAVEVAVLVTVSDRVVVTDVVIVDEGVDV